MSWVLIALSVSLLLSTLTAVGLYLLFAWQKGRGDKVLAAHAALWLEIDRVNKSIEDEMWAEAARDPNATTTRTH